MKGEDSGIAKSRVNEATSDFAKPFADSKKPTEQESSAIRSGLGRARLLNIEEKPRRELPRASANTSGCAELLTSSTSSEFRESGTSGDDPVRRKDRRGKGELNCDTSGATAGGPRREELRSGADVPRLARSRANGARAAFDKAHENEGVAGHVKAFSGGEASGLLTSRVGEGGPKWHTLTRNAELPGLPDDRGKGVSAILAESDTVKDRPNFAKERIGNEAPSTAQSTTKGLTPSRHAETTGTQRPRCEDDRNNKSIPECRKSNTNVAEPRKQPINSIGASVCMND